jgi:hypothetical protein
MAYKIHATLLSLMYGKIARTGFTMDFLEEVGDVCLLVSKKWHFLPKKSALLI